jgi:hypothetical protein
VKEKPRTKIGQVRQAWPEIRELLDAGHSLKDVCRWLNEIGLQIGYARLSDYVTQLRRRDAELPKPSGSGPKDDMAAAKQEVQPPIQPLAHLAEREKKRTGFSFNAEPDPKKLI